MFGRQLQLLCGTLHKGTVLGQQMVSKEPLPCNIDEKVNTSHFKMNKLTALWGPTGNRRGYRKDSFYSQWLFICSFWTLLDHVVTVQLPFGGFCRTASCVKLNVCNLGLLSCLAATITVRRSHSKVLHPGNSLSGLL